MHRGGDFRADVLFALAEELRLSGDATALTPSTASSSATRRTSIPINSIDGRLACLGTDLGLSAQQTVAIAVLGVLPGLMAHVIEEIDAGVPLRFIVDGEYVGEGSRPLPDDASGS